MHSNIVYIGQRRNVSGLAGYGLGDAQIDAQNRATNDIGAIKAAYNNVKAAGTLTVDYIQSAYAQIQNVINNYATQFGNTSRGAAGRVTLQTFVDQKIFPELNADIAAASQASGQPLYTGTDTSPSGGNSFPSVTLNINPGTTAESSGATQPSATPGPPSGISIPGYETTVTAPSPLWYENPAMLILAGLAVAVFLGSKGSNR